MKYDEGQWFNDIIVNIHCDVTMGRWCCLGNHISQQWEGDVAAAQSGTSVQLYYKALKHQHDHALNSPKWSKVLVMVFCIKNRYIPLNIYYYGFLVNEGTGLILVIDILSICP